jgi:hypothetical protein
LPDVGDVDIVAGQAHGGDDAGEKFAGGTDEGLALFVFVESGSLADEHEVGVGVAGAEDSLGARGGEVLAFAAGADGLVQRGELRGTRDFRFQI